MIKEAKTQHPVHDLISKRWSARSFSDKKITNEQVLTLIEAASWAPSSMNEQPWHYTYALHGTEGFQKLFDLLSVGNQIWCKEGGALMMCTAKKKFTKNGEQNRHYMHDTGMANANLLTQALSMGIYCHILGGFDRLKTNEAFNISDDEEEVVCFIVAGYLDSPEKLEEPFKTRELTPRSRKPLSEVGKLI